MKENNPFPFEGISQSTVEAVRSKHGSNKVEEQSKTSLWQMLKTTFAEPMFLLLVACSVIYFILGQFSEAWFMLGATVLVYSISIYQDNKSRKAIDALKEFTQPRASVIRDNQLLKIPSEEIVLGDYVVVSEGELVPADGQLKQANDFTVNESILTGESFSITKDSEGEDNNVFSGTLVESGQGVFEVMAIGSKTKLGQIGTSIADIGTTKTPLQLQIGSFVTKMAIIGSVIFLLICVIDYIKYGNVLSSLLKGLTIAMSVLPEEIPVTFATFMALGAWRLMKSGIIVKQTSTVEALGSATVLCTDKTGTITENSMELYQLYDFKSDKIYKNDSWQGSEIAEVVNAAMWSSEIVPFDPMEKDLHKVYGELTEVDERPLYQMVHEYPLSGKPPMMTHIFENKAGNRIVAAKGAPEAIINCSVLTDEEKKKLHDIVEGFAKEGLRVLGVATAQFEGTNYPETQQEFKFDFLGLVGFYDPPKKGIEKVFKSLYDAGIQVKIITGDNPATTVAITKQAHFKGHEKVITSKELLKLDDADFDKATMENSIFARMFPDLKLRVIESLKRQNQIVGMTGDGVNDGPALKAANIGIAMGKRGSEIARQASSLILTDDDFGKMVDAVAMGRKIYANLKKAIQYIISIHIPIILAVAIPSVFGWKYPSLFSPVHVIFLEMIMGPTCSIVYENEPLEKNSMLKPPRPTTSTFFSISELAISIFQGIGITIGILLMYQYAVNSGCNEVLTRSLVFTTLIIANIFLSLVNRSFYYSVLVTFTYKNYLFVGMVLITLALLAAILYIPVLAGFFKMVPLTLLQVGLCAATALVAVIGFEVFKFVKRRRDI